MLKINLRIIGVACVLVLAVLSIVLCCTKPKMHKAFQVNVIEYIIKINKDGSVSSTKTTTTNIIKEK